MGFAEFGDQMANLVPLVWTQVWFVAVMGSFVVLVRFLMRKKMMNLMNPKKHFRSPMCGSLSVGFLSGSSGI